MNIPIKYEEKPYTSAIDTWVVGGIIFHQIRFVETV